MTPQAALGGGGSRGFPVSRCGWSAGSDTHPPRISVRYIRTPLRSHFLIPNTGFRVFLSQGEEQTRCHHSYYIIALFSFQVFNFCHHSTFVNQSRYYRLHFQVGELRLRNGTWIFQSHIAINGSARIRKSLPVFLCIMRAPTKPSFA